MSIDKLALDNFHLSKLTKERDYCGLVQLVKPLLFLSQYDSPRCGPYSIAMALSYWLPKFNENKIGDVVAKEMTYHFRDNGILNGTTFPKGIKKYLQKYNFNNMSFKNSEFELLKRFIWAGVPCITLSARKNNIWRQHYNVAVAFDDSQEKIYFNDSKVKYKKNNRPGNLVLDYGQFLSQWNKAGYYLLKKWFLPVFPLVLSKTTHS
jgi:hypothetical protein